MNFKEFIEKLLAKQNLTEEESYNLMNLMISGELNHSQLSALLIALRMKVETPEEITGLSKSMRAAAKKFDIKDSYPVLDTCGTGGDSSGSYNISTAVSLLCAAADINIAKHGNRSVSSKAGSADVLLELGIKIDLPTDKMQSVFEKTGYSFLFAPLYHPAMKHVVPVRKELAIRTVFNVLGPLCNPAKITHQLLGVFSESIAEKMSKVLLNLNLKKAIVCNSKDGLDEISISDETLIYEIFQNKIEKKIIKPEDFGLTRYSKNDILGGYAADNAKIILDIFDNKIQGAKLDILLLNAGTALYVAEKSNSIKDGIELARNLILSGKAKQKLIEIQNAFKKQ